MSSGRRSWLLGLASLLALGCTQANKSQGGTIFMQNTQMTLWQLITALEQQMPVSVIKVKTVMGVELVETERTDDYVLLTAQGSSLADGLSVTNTSLLLHPSMKFDDTSGFGVELAGTCISRDEVSRRYGHLELTQHPRGRSLEETAVWSIHRSWGVLSFAFKQDRPDCLFDVSFRKVLR